MNMYGARKLENFNALVVKHIILFVRNVEKSQNQGLSYTIDERNSNDMVETRWDKCKLHWCLAKKPEHRYELRSTYGICLEEVGVPGKGTMLINRTIKPKVGDLVWCNNSFCTINGFIKQVKSFDDEEMIVTTRYKDHSKNFQFYVCEFYGVVEMVFDTMGDLCYMRTGNEQIEGI